MSKRDRFAGVIDKRIPVTSEQEPKKNPSFYDPEQGKNNLEEHEKDEMLGAIAEVDNARELQAKTMLLEQELAEAEQKLEEAEQEIDAAKQEVAAIVEKAIVPQADGTLVMGRIKMDSVGVTLPDDMTKEEWFILGNQLFKVDAALQWCMGDWLVHGENHGFGTVQELANLLDKQTGTIYNWAWVAREFPRELQPHPITEGELVSYRYEMLSHTHHQTIASYAEKEDYLHWLERAAYGDGDGKVWAVSRLKQELINAKRASRIIIGHSDDVLDPKKYRALMRLKTQDIAKLPAEQVASYQADLKKLREDLLIVERKLKRLSSKSSTDEADTST